MIYLDNAATTFPKPARVLEAVRKCLTAYGGNPGRGGHPLAMAAAEKIFDCREELASFFGLRDPARVILTSNCTAALNLALKGLSRPGDHWLVSDFEHNSVRRPLERLKAEGKIDYSRFSLLDFSLGELERLLRPNTRLLLCTAASNVCPVTAPLEKLGEFCRSHGLLFVVDGAQAAGHLGIYMDRMKISALCLPSHKGLYGIQGAGALLLADGCTPEPMLEGGSGSLSLDPGMPEELPERYEAGTLPTPAIVSLLEGVRFVRSIGLDAISAHERALAAECREMLASIPGSVVYAPDRTGSVLSFNVAGFSADQLASRLGGAGICVRGGYHCAPWAHQALGSVSPFGGTVRVSFSWFSTSADVAALFSALRAIRLGDL